MRVFIVASIWLLVAVGRHTPTALAQISYPQLGEAGQPQQPPAGLGQPAGPQQPGGIFGLFNQLGPQVESAKMLSSLFSGGGGGGSGGSGSPSTGGGQQQQPGGGLSAGQIMGQLSELIRSTQDRSAKVLASSQEQAQAAGQQTLAATQGAQTGIQSALAELGANIQRLASNNPNLLPDLKNLYQSVSSKLVSSAAPTGQQQFAQEVAKAAGAPQ